MTNGSVLRVLGAAATSFAFVLGAAAAGPSQAASPVSVHEVYPVPPSGVFTLHGHGFGHGHGMSQWGAYGAAVDKLSSASILGFYYPHTHLATEPVHTKVRVLLSATQAPTRGYLQVHATEGLALSVHGTTTTLPTASNGKPIVAWRLQRAKTGMSLRDKRNGAWHTRTKSEGTSATFRVPGGEVPVMQPSDTVLYRGVVVGELRSGMVEAVNRLPMEGYLRSVVPAEMPSSWPAAALQAQAIAARTYAAHGVEHPKASWFDLYGDTRDQAYLGVPGEAATSTAAVKKSAGRILEDGSEAPILAQYSSADGGWTAAGGESYLPAKHDPYDGVVPNDAHSWRLSLSAAAIVRGYPQLGKLKNIVVTGRNGLGQWGGRITTLTLQGSAQSVSLTGEDFQAAFGLRSTWWRPTPPPATPTQVTATLSQQTVTVTWQQPSGPAGAASVTGYVVSVSGSHPVTVGADARSVTVSGVTASSGTVSVRATSSAGESQPGRASYSS